MPLSPLLNKVGCSSTAGWDALFPLPLLSVHSETKDPLRIGPSLALSQRERFVPWSPGPVTVENAPPKEKKSLSLKSIPVNVTMVRPLEEETVPALLKEAEAMVAVVCVSKLKVEVLVFTGTDVMSNTTSTVPTSLVSSIRQILSTRSVIPTGTSAELMVKAAPSFPHTRKSPSS